LVRQSAKECGITVRTQLEEATQLNASDIQDLSRPAMLALLRSRFPSLARQRRTDVELRTALTSNVLHPVLPMGPVLPPPAGWSLIGQGASGWELAVTPWMAAHQPFFTARTRIAVCTESCFDSVNPSSAVAVWSNGTAAALATLNLRSRTDAALLGILLACTTAPLNTMFEVYCKWKPALQKLQRVIDGDVSYVGRSTSGGMLWCLQRVIVDRRLRPALLWITDQAGRLPNETARELAKYSKECLPVISRWPFPLPPLFVSYHPIPHLGRITMEHHQYTTDSRSFTWSESLIMSNLGWQWQHGYLSPRGFMPYYEKISGVCIRCRRIHTLG